MVEVKAKGTKPALVGAISGREVTPDRMFASMRGALPATERDSVEMTIRSNMGWELVRVKVVVTRLEHDVVGLESELWRFGAVVVECSDRPELIGCQVDGHFNSHKPPGSLRLHGAVHLLRARDGHEHVNTRCGRGRVDPSRTDLKF